MNFKKAIRILAPSYVGEVGEQPGGTGVVLQAADDIYIYGLFSRPHCLDFKDLI